MLKARGGRLCSGLAAALLGLSGGCAQHAQVPASSPRGPLVGEAPAELDQSALCGEWQRAVGDDEHALEHDAFPELSADACFTKVSYDEEHPRPEPMAPNCGYPRRQQPTVDHLLAEATRFEQWADAHPSRHGPYWQSCELEPERRRAVARHNARTLRALAAHLGSGKRYPYSAIPTFGYGSRRQSGSRLNRWRLGMPCLQLDEWDLSLLELNRLRAARAAAAFRAQVAPVVIVSGGAVHSRLNESVMLHHLVTCQHGVPPDRTLLDPCARHTHENLRNTGGLVVSLGGREAYIVLSGLQVGYLQEWSAFDLLGSSLDARSLRDFGFLPGSWRQASSGLDAGFWYTPYRFWAGPTDAIRNLTCVR
jgi:hypothetical protein